MQEIHLSFRHLDPILPKLALLDVVVAAVVVVVVAFSASVSAAVAVVVQQFQLLLDVVFVQSIQFVQAFAVADPFGVVAAVLAVVAVVGGSIGSAVARGDEAFQLWNLVASIVPSNPRCVEVLFAEVSVVVRVINNGQLGPIRITVDTCHFLSAALFMEYSLTIKWQPASLDKLMDTFPPFFASIERD